MSLADEIVDVTLVLLTKYLDNIKGKPVDLDGMSVEVFIEYKYYLYLESLQYGSFSTGDDFADGIARKVYQELSVFQRSFLFNKQSYSLMVTTSDEFFDYIKIAWGRESLESWEWSRG